MRLSIEDGKLIATPETLSDAVNIGLLASAGEGHMVEVAQDFSGDWTLEVQLRQRPGPRPGTKRPSEPKAEPEVAINGENPA